ncbi:50S ribosomal protein L24 [Candidatus Bathyarchaeota archaeon]|nr:50S ribosomal protein L24 [Candidatus Bathyarchaeota archaeon]
MAVKTKKPRKQRKKIIKATEKDRWKMMGANLSPRLRERYGVRTLPVRVDDTVKIMRGDFAGIEGKVIEVDRRKARVIVEGVTREKASGEQVRIPIHASKVMITNLNLEDRWRRERLEKASVELKPQE